MSVEFQYLSTIAIMASYKMDLTTLHVYYIWNDKRAYRGV